MDQIINKNLNLKAVEKAVVLSKKVGIKVGCFFVIGFSGETKEDILETINYAISLGDLALIVSFSALLHLFMGLNFMSRLSVAVS